MWYHDKAETICICAQQQKETTQAVFEETVSITLTDPKCKYNNVRLTRVPLKP